LDKIEEKLSTSKNNNIKEILEGIRNNPFFITPSEEDAASKVSD
jgi:hypothetical protein